MSEPGAAALRSLIDDGLRSWHGLPAGLQPVAFAPLIDAPGDAPAMAALGVRRAFVRFGELVPARAPAELWVSPADAEVWLVAVDDPPFAGAPHEVRQQLGLPALALDH